MSDTSMPHPSQLYPEHPLLAAEPEDDNPEDLIGDELPDEPDDDDDEDEESN